MEFISSGEVGLNSSDNASSTPIIAFVYMATRNCDIIKLAISAIITNQ